MFAFKRCYLSRLRQYNPCEATKAESHKLFYYIAVYLNEVQRLLPRKSL